MKSKRSYRHIDVKKVDEEALVDRALEVGADQVCVGLDVGKKEIVAAGRWSADCRMSLRRAEAKTRGVAEPLYAKSQRPGGPLLRAADCSMSLRRAEAKTRGMAEPLYAKSQRPGGPLLRGGRLQHVAPPRRYGTPAGVTEHPSTCQMKAMSF